MRAGFLSDTLSIPAEDLRGHLALAAQQQQPRGERPPGSSPRLMSLHGFAAAVQALGYLTACSEQSQAGRESRLLGVTVYFPNAGILDVGLRRTRWIIP